MRIHAHQPTVTNAGAGALVLGLALLLLAGLSSLALAGDGARLAPVELPLAASGLADATALSSRVVTRTSDVRTGAFIVYDDAPPPTSGSTDTPPLPPLPPIGDAACVGIPILPGDDIQAAVNAGGEGATFCFAPGTYRLADEIRPAHRQRLVGAPGTLLKGSKVLEGFRQDGGRWVIGDQTQRFNPRGECAEGFEGCSRAEDVYLDGEPLRRVLQRADLEPGAVFLDEARDEIVLADDPRGHLVEAAVAWHAFVGRRPDWSAANGVLVRGFTIEQFGGMAQFGAIETFVGTDWTIERNEVRRNHGVGIGANHGATVRGNRVHHNGQLGIRGTGEDILVEGNEIAYNNTLGFDPSWEAGGTKWLQTTDLVVRENRSHDNVGMGLWTDFDNVGTIYEDNVVEDNAHAGIFHEISYDARIEGNTVRRNGFEGQTWGYGAGIQVAHSSGVVVTGNVVEDNFNAISLIQQERGSGRLGPFELRDIRVVDNIVAPGQGRTGIYQDVGLPELARTRNIEFTHNVYDVDLRDPRFHVEGQPATFEMWRSEGLDLDASLRTGAG